MICRKCDVCGTFIDDPEFVQLSVDVYVTDEGSNQDAKESARADCCDACLAAGRAVPFLLKRAGWNLDPELPVEVAAGQPVSVAVPWVEDPVTGARYVPTASLDEGCPF